MSLKHDALRIIPQIWNKVMGDSLSTAQKQAAIRKAAIDTWEDYRRHAFGSDEYYPISKTSKNMTEEGPLGWMIIDALDTLMIMDLDDYVAEARDFVSHINYDIDNTVSVFETTIRMLGGLLSAYYLSGDQLYLDKAIDLGDRLMFAFDTPTKVPPPGVNLRNGLSYRYLRISSLAEISTLQIEFKYLSYLTKNESYWNAVQTTMQVLERSKPVDGLAPISFSNQLGRFQGSEIRLGSRGDSYYEYLLKQWLQTSQKEDVYFSMYNESVNGIFDHMLSRSKPSNLLYIGELRNGIGRRLSSKMDHLVCFAGAMLGLGATHGLNFTEAKTKEWWTEWNLEQIRVAAEITRTCVATYITTQTGLAPEIVNFQDGDKSEVDFYIKTNDVHNLQRPETVESLFVMYRLTGDAKYREWGWKIFKAFQKHSRNSDGSYVSLDDVTTGAKRDALESFWMAETLKYLYLLFDDTNKLPLDKVVFNTEAHPFPVIPLVYGTFSRAPDV